MGEWKEWEKTGILHTKNIHILYDEKIYKYFIVVAYLTSLFQSSK